MITLELRSGRGRRILREKRKRGARSVETQRKTSLSKGAFPLARAFAPQKRKAQVFGTFCEKVHAQPEVEKRRNEGVSDEVNHAPNNPRTQKVENCKALPFRGTLPHWSHESPTPRRSKRTT